MSVEWCATRGFHDKITHPDTIHNHKLGSSSYGNHPSIRRVQDEDVIAFVNELQAAGPKTKLVLQFLRKKTGSRFELKQACNIQGRSQLRREAEGSTARVYKCGEKAGSWRSRILHSDRNTATIYVDDDKLAQTIAFQTLKLRRFFEDFPQVLMVDTTHNTNDARYKLFSFMIHDVFGHLFVGSCDSM
ncbi:hypothetical protein PI124_g2740 [Phytophthora idaei]|nr:hypothetical protein PI124_g2740 [Phytophthora idaei]